MTRRATRQWGLRLPAILSLALLPTLVVPGCEGSEGPTDPANGGGGNGSPTAPPFVRSLALSPAGFPVSYDQLPAFLEEASSFPDAGIFWNGAWRQDVIGGSDAGTPPEGAVLVASAAGTFDYAPVLAFGWRGGETPHIAIPSNPENSWRNEEAAALYVQVVTEVARTHRPPFVFLGNESDQYFDVDPEDYLRWVAVYEAAYDSIRAASPETRVGPIIQYERTAGIGTLAGQTQPSWGAVTAHDLERVDVFGITLYPFFAHATPAGIPPGYLDPLLDRIGDTPIAITETGWPAEDAPGFTPPWETSEAHQVAYLDRLEALLDGIDTPLVSWVWLHPPTYTPDGPLSLLEWNLFHSLSLRRADGSARPVHGAWGAFEPVR